MKNLVVIVLVALSLNVFANNDKKTNAEIRRVEVKGVVFEMVNNEKVALPLAEITVNGAESYESDLSGSFGFTMTNKDKFEVSFEGYTTVVKEVVDKAKNEVFLEIELKKNYNLAKN